MQRYLLAVLRSFLVASELSRYKDFGPSFDCTIDEFELLVDTLQAQSADNCVLARECIAELRCWVRVVDSK